MVFPFIWAAEASVSTVVAGVLVGFLVASKSFHGLFVLTCAFVSVAWSGAPLLYDGRHTLASLCLVDICLDKNQLSLWHEEAFLQLLVKKKEHPNYIGQDFVYKSDGVHVSAML